MSPTYTIVVSCIQFLGISLQQLSSVVYQPDPADATTILSVEKDSYLKI